MHARVAATRRDATHKVTTALRPDRHRGHGRARDGAQPAARALDHGRRVRGVPSPARLQAQLTGALVVVADRFYPSNEICSCCGAVRAELAPPQRTFCCEACGHAFRCDPNAAQDLEHLAAGFAVTACGEERSGPARGRRVKRSPVARTDIHMSDRSQANGKRPSAPPTTSPSPALLSGRTRATAAPTQAARPPRPGEVRSRLARLGSLRRVASRRDTAAAASALAFTIAGEGRRRAEATIKGS